MHIIIIVALCIFTATLALSMRRMSRENAENSRLLIEYTQLVNVHGQDDRRVREFTSRHAENAKLVRLMRKVDRVRRYLQTHPNA